MFDESAKLQKLSVKELRRQAAVKNVPLTQIAAAVEKADLINLILKAGPVTDTYDVQLWAKVHSAATIAKAVKDKTTGKKKKKKKDKKRRRSSSSSSSSHSSRERRKRRSKSPCLNRRHRSRSQKKRGRSHRREKSRSSSPSLTIIVPPQAKAGRNDLRALPPAPNDAGSASSGLKALPGIEAAIVSATAPAKSSQPTIAQKGMAAAAALGFDILPKAPVTKPSAPAEGLRPSINSAAPAPYGAGLLPGGRICIQYLCTSKCDLGGHCPEAHILDPEEEMRVRARFKEQECHYGAQCSRPGCLFRHPGERFEEGQFVPEGQQIALRATPQGMQLDFM